MTDGPDTVLFDGSKYMGFDKAVARRKRKASVRWESVKGPLR